MLQLWRSCVLFVICLTICALLLEKYALITSTNTDWNSIKIITRKPIDRERSDALLSDKTLNDHSVPNGLIMHQRVNISQQSHARPTIYNNKPIRKTISSNLFSIFSDDYVPDVYKTMLMDNSTIHFCQIVAKPEHALEIDMFVRSVLLHARRSGVFFHFIATEGAEKGLPKIFGTITHAFVDVKYEIVEVLNLTDYLNEKFENKVTFNHPWSGIYGTGKIFMYDLLPHVNTCIIIDSDTLFGTDPAFLWNEAKLHLQPPVSIAATWAPIHEHFNSGVMVQDLERMRNTEFSHFITMKGCQSVNNAGKKTFQCAHDQHLLLQILNSHRELFYLLSVSWNLDNCSFYRDFKFNSFCDEVTGYFFGVVHFCCFELIYAYERANRYMKIAGLNIYFRYLKTLNFTSFGEMNVYRVRGKI